MTDGSVREEGAERSPQPADAGQALAPEPASAAPSLPASLSRRGALGTAASGAPGLTAADVMRLQRQAGNVAVARLIAARQPATAAAPPASSIAPLPEAAPEPAAELEPAAAAPAMEPGHEDAATAEQDIAEPEAELEIEAEHEADDESAGEALLAEQRAGSVQVRRSFLGDLWDGAKDLVHKGKAWLEDHVVDPIRDLATNAWNGIVGIGNTVSSVWAGGESGAGQVRDDAVGALHGAREYQQSAFAAMGEREQEARGTIPTIAPAAPVPMDSRAKDDMGEAAEEAHKAQDGPGGIGKQLLEGALLGDAQKHPTGWNTIGQVAIGFVPVLGQMADVRDLILAIKRLHETGWSDGGAWGNLVLVGLAFIPGLGDVLKGGSRLLGSHIGKGLRGMRDVGGRIWSGAARKIPGLAKGARQWGSRIVAAAGRMRGQVVKGITRLATGARERAKSAVRTIRNFLGQMGGWAQSQLDRARDWASSAKDGVKGILGRIAGAVTSAVNKIVDSAKEWIAAARDTVKQAVAKGKEIAKRMRERIKNLVANANEFRKWAIAQAQERAKRLAETARTYAKKRYDDAKAAAVRLREKTTGAIKGFVRKQLRRIADTAMTVLGPVIRRIPKVFREKLMTLWNRAKQLVPESEPGAAGALPGKLPAPMSIDVKAMDELYGGHTLERHGGDLPLEDMRKRVMNQLPGVPQAATALKFRDPETMQRAIDYAYLAHRDEIVKNFASEAPERMEFTVQFERAGEGYRNIGTRKAPKAERIPSSEVNHVLITLNAKPEAPGGFYLVRAFPRWDKGVPDAE